MDTTPLFTNDAVVLGILMLCLGFVFYTSSLQNHFWQKFYKFVPSILVAYLLPAILTSLGIISPEWQNTTASGEIQTYSSGLYRMASRYLLPAALVLLTLSVDLKAVMRLGYKALIMFFTATLGIVIGGPIAILIMSIFSPEAVGGVGADAVWRGLATLAGSWIGGGANQIAMLEIYGFNQEHYGGFVLVDIVVANLLLAGLLIGVGRQKQIDKWLRADNSAIETLKNKIVNYTESIKHIPSLTDYMMIFAIAFGAIGIAHFCSDNITKYLTTNFEAVRNPSSPLSSLGSEFFWLITISVLIGISFSFSKFREYEGAGASKFGSVFIYILVATIGMKMDLLSVFQNPSLFFVGLIWMSIHILLLFAVAKLIKAPYFFIAVGSTANVGGAASAPIAATAFHPALSAVGVLLAVLGYVVGTYAAMFTAELMRIVAP